MILVKVYPRRGNDGNVHKFDDVPVTIGRSIENDVVLSDASVSARHAVIDRDADGRLRIRDLSSTNGTHKSGQKIETVPLVGIEKVRFGRVEAEIATNDEEIEPTVRIDLASLEDESSADWPMAKGLRICSALFALEILNQFLQTWLLKVSWQTHVFAGEAIASCMVLIVISGVLAGISKLHQKRYQFFPLLALTTAFAFVLDLASAVGPFIAFNLNAPAVTSALGVLLASSMAAVYGLLLARRLSPETSPRLRAGIVIGLLVLFHAASRLPSLLNDEPVSDSPDMLITYPIRSFSADRYTMDRFLGGIDRLEPRLETSRSDLLEKEKKREAAAD